MIKGTNHNSGSSLKCETLAHCPICNSDEIRQELEGYDYETQTGSYGIWMCRDCHIRFTNPRPIESEIPKLYDQRETLDFRQSSHFLEKIRMHQHQRRIGALMNKLSLPPKAKVLDYGCGDSTFSLALADHFEVTAVDFDPKAPPVLQQPRKTAFAIHYQQIQEWSGTNDSRYDLIILRHVLEHTSLPGDLLHGLGERMNEGGYLLIEVPNYNTIWVRLFKRFWSGLYLPRHYYHFTKDTLPKVLPSQFEIISLRGMHGPQIGRSLAYLTGGSLTNTSLLGLILYPWQILGDLVAGRTNNLQCIARKSGGKEHE